MALLQWITASPRTANSPVATNSSIKLSRLLAKCPALLTEKSLSFAVNIKVPSLFLVTGREGWLKSRDVLNIINKPVFFKSLLNYFRENISAVITIWGKTFSA